MKQGLVALLVLLTLSACSGDSSTDGVEGAEQGIENRQEATTSTTTTIVSEPDDDLAGPEIDPATAEAFEAALSGREADAQRAIEDFTQNGRKKAIAIAGATILFSDDGLDETCGSLDDGNQRELYRSPDCEAAEVRRDYYGIEGDAGNISNFSYSRGIWGQENETWDYSDAHFYEIRMGTDDGVDDPPYPLLAALALDRELAPFLEDSILINGIYAYDWGSDATDCLITLVVENVMTDADFQLQRPSNWTFFDFIGGEIPLYRSTGEDVRIRPGRFRLFPFVLGTRCNDLYEVSTDFIRMSEFEGNTLYNLIDEGIFRLEARPID
jgi:hypothetical protein